MKRGGEDQIKAPLMRLIRFGQWKASSVVQEQLGKKKTGERAGPKAGGNLGGLKKRFRSGLGINVCRSQVVGVDFGVVGVDRVGEGAGLDQG